jgi:hypothetical protein
MSFVSMMERLQIKDENSSSSSSRYGIYNQSIPPTIQQEQQQILKNHGHHNNDKSKNGKSNGDQKSIMSSSTPSTPRLGISTFDLSPTLAEDMGLPKNYKGAVAYAVIPGSPAYKAGIRGTTLDVDKSGYLIRKGDVIISIDGHKVNGAGDILKQIKNKHIGDLFTLIVNRNGQIINMAARLESSFTQPHY